MTDASFGAAGYAASIEDDSNQKLSSLRKSYVPVAHGSKTFTPAQIKMSIHAKEFLAIYFAFKEFGHIFWGAPKPVIILTDNKDVTRFSQTKIVPPALWNVCDYVIQFNFVVAHIPGAQNTAADYLSRLEADPKDTLVMKIREDVQTLPIELNVQSAGVSQKQQIFSPMMTMRQRNNIGQGIKQSGKIQLLMSPLLQYKLSQQIWSNNNLMYKSD